MDPNPVEEEKNRRSNTMQQCFLNASQAPVFLTDSIPFLIFLEFIQSIVLISVDME